MRQDNLFLHIRVGDHQQHSRLHRYSIEPSLTLSSHVHTELSCLRYSYVALLRSNSGAVDQGPVGVADGLGDVQDCQHHPTCNFMLYYRLEPLSGGSTDYSHFTVLITM